LTFIVLGYISMQKATIFWAEIGQRIQELYFLFFVFSWVYTRPRSRIFLAGTFVVVMAVITVFDWLGWDPAIAQLKMLTWLIPGVYCAIFLLLPTYFGKLLMPKPVPERVRFK